MGYNMAINMEPRRITPEVQGLISETETLGRKKDINWREIVSLEKSVLNLWFNKPNLRNTIHHQFTDALTKLQEVDHEHQRAVNAVLMLHNIAMHPNTAYGFIDEVVAYSDNFGFAGNLTREDIHSLLEIVEKENI